MSSPYAKIGICKSLIVPFTPCTETANLEAAIVSCSMTNIDENPVLTDGFELREPSGLPNRNCIEIDIPPEVDYVELVITTCTLFDPRLDAAFNYSDIVLKEDGTCVVLAKPKGGADCLCACGDAGCPVKFSMITWSMAFCSDGTPHPGGQFVITAYPCVEPRPNTSSITTNAEGNGREYLFRLCEPGDLFGVDTAIDPVLYDDMLNGVDMADWEALTNPDGRCKYEWLSNICPPGDCSCGLCGGEPISPVIEPLKEEEGAGRTPIAPRSIVDNADKELVDA